MASDLFSGTGAYSSSYSGSPPQGLSIFLGREVEILKTKQLLDGTGLVTLCGVDGVGKTSLALQVAGEMPENFRDGVFFVPLDCIVSPESIADAIAKKLDIKIDPRLDPLEQFLTELSSKKILLILDGFENGPGQSLFIKQLVGRTTSVKIIITSRQRLHIENEAVIEVHGLPVPDRDSPDPESYPAVQLFLQQARIFPNFEPDLASIGHICRLMDGMPLAIVLAAAWSASLSCEQIAHQIEQSLALQTPGKASGEYESMLAIFDSVWNFFSETEKRTLMGLSVFKGGFSNQAAYKITGASFFFLDSVLNKKLIQRNKPQRYVLHASLLQYLQEKLQANPVLATDVEIRHGSYYLGLLRDSEIAMGLPESMFLFEDILSDADNIRFAWKRTVAVGNLGLVQSALPAWMSIMWNRGWYKDALDALELLPIRLSEFSSNDPKVALIYAQTKKFLGEFYCLNGDFQSGLREFQNGIQRINESDQPREESEMYHLSGNYYSTGGHSQDSKVMYQLGLVLAEKIGDLSLVHKFISRLAAEAYLEADYQGAIPIAKHALEIARQLDDTGRIVQSLSDLGNLYYAIKEYPRAKELLKESLGYLPDIGNQILEYNILNKLGRVLTANKEYAYASQTFSHGLDLLNAANADLLAAEMLVSVAELLNDMKEKTIAVPLVNLIMNHPLISMDLKARAGHLHEVLSAEKIQPEDRNWGLDQMMRVAGDVKLILDQKKTFQ